MNTFQQHYPLSPKKFWKKEIPVMLSTGILFLIIFIGISIALIAGEGTAAFPLLGIIAAGIVIFWIVIMLLYALYFKAYIRTYMYEGSENFITIKKKFFTPQEIHVQYQKIQDVYVDQDLLDRMMGLYDVHIASATVSSSMEAHIDGVDAATAEGLKNFFLDKIQTGSSQQAQQQTASTAGNPTSPVAAAPTAPLFSGNISSTTYPLQPAWLTRSILGIIVSSLFLGFIFSNYIIGEGYPLSVDLLIILAVSAVFFIIKLIYILLWRKNYRFEFLPEFILLHTGVISMSEKHVPYGSIQDVSVSQTILDRIFGIANVTIQNAAQSVGKNRNNGNIVIPGQTPNAAQEITEALKSVLLTKNSARTGL